MIVLRYRRPDLPRGFKCPGVPVVPAVGIVFSVTLIAGLNPTTWLRFAVWFVIGLVIYAAYGYRNSRLNRSGTSEEVAAD